MSALELVTPTAGPGRGRVGLATRRVSGTSFDPAAGAVAGVATPADLDPQLEAVAAVCALCNDARLEAGPGRGARAVGAPTEAALLTLAEKLAAPGGGSGGKGGGLDAAPRAFGERCGVGGWVGGWVVGWVGGRVGGWVGGWLAGRGAASHCTASRLARLESARPTILLSPPQPDPAGHPGV